MGYASGLPRCLEPMRRWGPESDPDPVCWRPRGHGRGGTRAARRHLSRTAYLNELARSQENRGRYRRAA